MKSNISPGGDGIPAELLQEGRDKMVYVLFALCDRIWETECVLKEWVIVKLAKKANSTE